MNAMSELAMPWPGNWRHAHIDLKSFMYDTIAGVDPVPPAYEQFGFGAPNYYLSSTARFFAPTGTGRQSQIQANLLLPVQINQGVDPDTLRLGVGFAWSQRGGAVGQFVNWRVGISLMDNDVYPNSTPIRWVDKRSSIASVDYRRHCDIMPTMVETFAPMRKSIMVGVYFARARSIGGLVDDCAGDAHIVGVTLYYRVA